MADSYFNQSSHDTSFYEDDDDDTEYDALNGETFGEDVPTSDWEEVHEKLSSTLLEQRSFDDENNLLSERVASFILDDEGEEIANRPVKSHTAEPSTSGGNWWSNFSKQESNTTTKTSATQIDSMWDNREPRKPFFGNRPGPSGSQTSAIPKILTVEELEKTMIKGAAPSNASKPSSPLTNTFYHEENDLPVNMMRAQMNGQYIRNRQPPTVPTRAGRPINCRVRYQPHDHGMRHHMQQFPNILPNPFRFPDVSQPPGRPHYADMPMHRPPQTMPIRHIPGHIFPGSAPEPRFASGPGMYRPRMPAPQDNRSYHAQPYGNQGRVWVVEPVDEYAGLMTNYEKNWLGSIQTMQIYTNHPHQDDYYFQTYSQRQKGNAWKPPGQFFASRNREENTRPAYTPHQFENSLGKLQVGSVMAPRLIIDSDVTENLDSHSKQVEKKSKQILLHIEEMFKYVLQMEPNGASTPPSLISQIDKQEKIMSILMSEDKLVSIMSIRKGRSLVHRLLPYLLAPNPLIHKILLELPTITKKEDPQILSFLPYFRTYLAKVPLDSLVEISKRYPTSYLLSNQVTTSVMANLVERAEQVLPSCESNQVVEDWIATLARLAEACQNRVDGERPVVGINPTALTSHLNLLTGRVQPEVIAALCNLLSNRDPGPATTPAPCDL